MKHIFDINQNIKEVVGRSITRAAPFRNVKSGQLIKIAFLDAAPDYSNQTLESYWEKYFPHISINYEDEFFYNIKERYETSKRIQSTFQAIDPGVRQTLFDHIVEFWQKTYVNVYFERVDDPALADVRVGVSDYASVNFAPGALAEPGREQLGDVYLNSALVNSASGLTGQLALSALIHEFGHVLGLSHPSRLEGDGRLPIEYGKQLYSVMSYGSVLLSGRPITPMLFDAVGLERLGLLKTGLNTGNTTYTFTDSAAGMLLIDTDGVDTIDAKATTTANEIDLRATDFTAGKAYFSSIGIGSGKWNIAIYEGVVIENAYGGSGADTLIGNDADNELDGGAGNDKLFGGVGLDTYVFSGRAWGKDEIIDSDGQGQIKIDGKTIAGLMRFRLKRSSQYVLDYAGVKYFCELRQITQSDGSHTYDLVLTPEGQTANVITVHNFDLAAAQTSQTWHSQKLG